MAMQSAYQLLMRQIAQQRPNLSHLYDALFIEDGGPRDKSLIEISGKPNSGKSTLLWELMARCLLPTYFDGKYCSVIFIDLGHKFSKPHFLNKIRSLLQLSNENCTAEEYDEVARKCLDSMVVLSCYSTEEFDQALDDMEDMLMANQNVSLIAIDHLNAFYWLEAGIQLLRMSTHYSKILAKLRHLCAAHNICCAYSVDTNYIDATLRHPAAHGLCPMLIDYKFRLGLFRDGSRTLNERPITIDERGIHFKKAFAS